VDIHANNKFIEEFVYQVALILNERKIFALTDKHVKHFGHNADVKIHLYFP
jgi:hypothetical protein